jgi:hypothetical protein
VEELQRARLMRTYSLSQVLRGVVRWTYLQSGTLRSNAVFQRTVDEPDADTVDGENHGEDEASGTSADLVVNINKQSYTFVKRRAMSTGTAGTAKGVDIDKCKDDVMYEPLPGGEQGDVVLLMQFCPLYIQHPCCSGFQGVALAQACQCRRRPHVIMLP